MCKLLVVDVGKQIAELIMRGRSLFIGQKPAQKRQFFLAKQGDCTPVIGGAKHQKQYFIKRIKRFQGLAQVFQFLEIFKNSM